MNRLPISNEFVAAAEAQGFGSAWVAPDDNAADYAYAFQSLAGALYEKTLPVRRRNLAGQDFSYEFHYVTGTNFPNAYAFSDSSKRLFVGFTASLYGLVDIVCRKIFEDDGVLEIFEEDISVTAARELKLTLDMLDLGRKDSAILSNFLVDAEQLHAPPPADWRECYTVAGDFLLATDLRYRVRDAILSYFFHHEMGHLIDGHVGLLSGRYGAGAVGEADPRSDRTPQRLAMEFQADKAAAKTLALISNSRRMFCRHMGVESDWNRIVTLDLLAIFVAHTILAMTEFTADYVIKGDRLTEAEMKNIFQQTEQYPSVGVRMIAAANTYMTALAPLDTMVDDFVEPEPRRYYKSLQMMKRLGDIYAEFAMMLVVSRVFEDDFDMERKDIAASAAIAQLNRDCAPYAFGGIGSG